MLNLEPCSCHLAPVEDPKAGITRVERVLFLIAKETTTWSHCGCGCCCCCCYIGLCDNMFIMSMCMCFVVALLLSIDDIDVCFHFSHGPFFWRHDGKSTC